MCRFGLKIIESLLCEMTRDKENPVCDQEIGLGLLDEALDC